MSSVSLANAAIQDLVQKEDKGVAMQLEEKSLMNQRSQAKQVDTLQNVARNEDEKTTAQGVDASLFGTDAKQIMRQASSRSITSKKGEAEAAIAQRSKSHMVTKLRDKGTAREIRKQLDDYLSSLDKADKSVFEWEMRVAEIGEEMKKVQGSRHNSE
ncbi:hypothetical protein ACHAWO_006571 [Cyclotella atomus]|uniref:Uncharacterized protein n=1 Tax=Cyclotella atomus TaxID=382360 RepID=A0ABD3NNJ8_9STRA